MMSSNENPDQEIEQVLQSHFEAEAEDLKAPEGLWGRLESRLSADPGKGDITPVWQRLVRRGRWGMSPAFAAVVLLVIVVSVAWLATAGSEQDSAVSELALGTGDSSSTATLTLASIPGPAATAAPRASRSASAASATPAPAATRAPTASGPPGTAGSAGARGASGANVGNTGGFNFFSEDDGESSTDSLFDFQSQSAPTINDTGLAPLTLPAASPDSRGQLETVQRQVISQGSVSLDVEDVPFAATQVRLIAESVGGFVEQLTSQGVEERQQSTITIRVPQPEFFSVFDRVKSLGRVLNETAGSEDVTERFIDLEARLKSAGREELSLLSLLERAEKVSEILTIERELFRIRTELEQVRGQLNFLERRVSLATITVALFPPQFRVGQLPTASLSLAVLDVSQRVEELKALVSAVGGEFDQVFTTVQNGAERASLTVRVFEKDFNNVVSAIEAMGEINNKEVQEGTVFQDAETARPEDPDSHIGVSFFEKAPFRDGQPPTASLVLEMSDVPQRLEEVKALVSAAGGEIDQIFTTARDGAERASLTVRVFAKDFDRVVAAIESKGEVKRKEVQHEIDPSDTDTPVPDEPDSLISVEFAETPASNTGRWVAIGAAGAAVMLGLLFYITFQTGRRRGEME